MLNSLIRYGIIGATVFLLCFLVGPVQAGQRIKPQETLKSMFHQFAEKMDMRQFDRYYAKDFVLVSNQVTYQEKAYRALEAGIFKKLKSLKVLKYNDIFSSSNKVAARMAIALTEKSGVKKTFHVILIARINESNKIDRIWEMTYPTWQDKLKRP